MLSRDLPVTVELPPAREGLTLQSVTMTDAQIRQFDGPDFGETSSNGFMLPMCSFWFCNFAAGAYPTGPNAQIRNAPAPSHVFTAGQILPIDANNRIVREVPSAVLIINAADFTSPHRIETGFTALPAGGNAANTMKVIVPCLRITYT
jgi:hypothetical protein